MTGRPLVSAVEAARRELELDWAREEQRELELTQAETYARDPLAWLDSGHIWIASPFNHDELWTPELEREIATGRRKLRPMRLRLFPDQEETIRAWIDIDHLRATGELVYENVIIEKTRQIGETWAFAGTICWALHYHGVNGLAMHTKATKIDDGGQRNTVSSLFGRVRYIDKRLDPARLPGVAQRLVFRPFSRDPAKVENPAKGSFWIGEGQTDNPGRGDTFDAMLGDEFAFVEHADRVFAAIDEACPNGKALLSTVNGDSTAHARLAKEKPRGYAYLRLHWSTHPLYSRGSHVAGDDPGCILCEGNRQGLRWDPTDPRCHRYPGKVTSPWYDDRVIGKTDEQVANELDIDRERAKTGRVYPEFSSSVHVVETGIPYEPGLHHATELAIDYGLDATSVLVLQDAPLELRIIGILECGSLFGTSGVPDNVATELRRYLRALGVEERLLDPEWTRKMYAIGDPSGLDKSYQTGISAVAAYKRHGFVFGAPPRRLMKTVTPSITAAKLLLEGTPKPVKVCGVNAPEFAVHARENVWRTGPDGRALGLDDDVHNHAMRAFAYYALAKFPPEPRREAAADPFDDEPAETDALLYRRRARPGLLRPGARL